MTPAVQRKTILEFRVDPRVQWEHETKLSFGSYVKRVLKEGGFKMAGRITQFIDPNDGFIVYQQEV